MHPAINPQTPATAGGYVPYFYQAGLYLGQDQPHDQSRRGPPTSAYARYDFSSDLPLWRPLSGPQSVEQIITRGYLSVPASEPEIAMISDKHQTSWLGLEDVISQVRQRRTLYRQNMDEIDQGICEAQNAVFRQEAAQGTPADQGQQYAVSKAVQGLYEQKRFERAKLWQDVSKLRQTLPEAAQQYLSAYRKLSILDDSEGDGQ